MCSFGSVTAWTRWGRFGQPVAGTRWTVTTAAALTDSSSAPITAARGPACGARGPAGRRAAFPADPARKPDIGDEKKKCCFVQYFSPRFFNNSHQVLSS